MARRVNTGRPQWIRVYADSPVDAMWTYYRQFEVADWVRRTYGDWLPLENALAARDCVRQAREYFFSARSAPLLTKPVLLYYGMVSLGKLLFLFQDSPLYTIDDIESFERRGHGLKHMDPVSEVSPYEIEAGKLEITADAGKTGAPPVPRGVFPRLAEVVNKSSVSSWFGHTIAILDVLRAIPQLDTVLQQALGPAAGYSGIPADTLTHTDGSIELIVDMTKVGATSVDAVQAKVPYLHSTKVAFAPLQDRSSRDADKISIHLQSEAEGFGIVVREEFYDGTYAFPPAWRGHRFEGLLASYMAMYALSIVARYKPHRWSHILEGRDSPLLPVIETLMTTSERWWPNLLLNRLTGMWINFSSPSYW